MRLPPSYAGIFALRRPCALISTRPELLWPSRGFSSKPKTPKAVIFDLGGVVLGSPFPAIKSFETDAGLAEGSIFKAAALAGEEKGAFFRLERGELTLEDFLPLFTAELAAAGLKGFNGLPLSELFERMERSFLPNPAMVTAIRAVRAEGVRTAALTNNWVRRSGASLPEPLVRELFPLFDVVVESCRAGMRKPEPRIYERVAQQLRLPSPDAVRPRRRGQSPRTARVARRCARARR